MKDDVRDELRQSVSSLHPSAFIPALGPVAQRNQSVCLLKTLSQVRVLPGPPIALRSSSTGKESSSFKREAAGSNPASGSNFSGLWSNGRMPALQAERR